MGCLCLRYYLFTLYLITYLTKNIVEAKKLTVQTNEAELEESGNSKSLSKITAKLRNVTFNSQGSKTTITKPEESHTTFSKNPNLIKKSPCGDITFFFIVGVTNYGNETYVNEEARALYSNTFVIAGDCFK